MREGWLNRSRWLIAWAGLVLAGSLAIVRVDITQRREAFETEARIAHRLLSQRAVQQDAILATLVLLQPVVDARVKAEQHLPAVYPQLSAVLRRDHGQDWSDNALRAAEARSLRTRQAELGSVDTTANQFVLVHAGQPASFALRIDVQRMVPWNEWPIEKDGPVSVALVHAGQSLLVQPGQARDAQPVGLTKGFVFTKQLAAASQPFELQLRRAAGPMQWPWVWLFVWSLVAALALAGLAAWQQARRGRRRAEELLRVGQVARLNAMGELAAGIAHELNQPLAAVISSAQAARRLLDDDPPALDTARQALVQVATQGRRAADVVARMRRRVELPESTGPSRPVQLEPVVRQVLELFEPQTRRLGVTATLVGRSAPVLADPVALEQIVHNLICNALQALENVALTERRLTLQMATERGQGVLTVRDSGPGIAAEALSRLFEPFYSTRRGGLGLGLNLCETLALAMCGTLEARNASARGAEFRLALPLAGATA